MGLYSLYLRRWLAAFPREQVLVLRSEDYRQNVTAVMQTVFTHLGVGEAGDETQQAGLQYSYRVYWS